MPTKPEEEKKVKRSYAITRSSDKRLHRLAVRLNSSLNGVVEEALAVFEEVLDSGISVTAARRWRTDREEEENP